MQGREQERIRKNYLEAMGIQTWFPRCQLANAQPPRPFDWIEEEATRFEQETLQINTTSALSKPSESSLQRPTQPAEGAIQNKIKADSYSRPSAAEILGQVIPEPSATAKSIETEIAAPVRKKATPATSRFRLIVQTVSDECLVVAEMPHTGLNQFTRFHQRLLNDILHALHLTSTSKPEVREFVWPIGINKGLMGQMDQDDLAAADAVCAFLSNQFGLARHKVVLLFGQASARFVVDPERKFDELRGIQKGLHAGQHFAVSHGLNELMKVPRLKAETWQDLSPLLSLTTPKDEEAPPV